MPSFDVKALIGETTEYDKKQSLEVHLTTNNFSLGQENYSYE